MDPMLEQGLPDEVKAAMVTDRRLVAALQRLVKRVEGTPHHEALEAMGFPMRELADSVVCHAYLDEGPAAEGRARRFLIHLAGRLLREEGWGPPQGHLQPV